MFILTHSKRRVNLQEPDPETIVLDDIVHHLAHECRFAGACGTFYSVAQHSQIVSAMVEQESREVALYGLLHDAHEYLIKDVPHPLKLLLQPEYSELEQRLQTAIYKALRIRLPTDEEMAVVSRIDRQVLASEFVQLFNLSPQHATEYAGAEPIAGLTITPARFTDVKWSFFSRLRSLWH